MNRLLKRVAIGAILLSMVLLPALPMWASPGWWDIDWDYRNVLSFKASDIDENLTNFPILVTLNPSRFDFNKAKDNGEDIRFIDSDDSTELKYEIERWDKPSEEALVWVNVPQIDKNTEYTDYIYMYYGNPDASDGQNVAGTWSSNYMAVYHMKDDPDNQHIQDSTSYDAEGTKAGANQPIETVGDKTAYAQDFDPTNPDYIVIAAEETQLDFTSGNFSLIARVMSDVNSAVTKYIFNRGAANFDGWGLSNYGLSLYFYTRQAGTTQDTYATGVMPIGTYTTVGISRSGAVVTIFLAGVDVTSSHGVHIDPKSADREGVIGAHYDYNNPWDGKIEFLAIMDVARSADWMEAQHLSMTGGLIYYGSKDPPPTVTTLSATNVYIDGGTHATLNGELAGLGGAPSVDIWFEWGYDTNYGNTVGQQTVTSTGIYTHSLTKVSPSRTVYYRFAGENVDGTTYGSSQTLRISSVWYTIAENIPVIYGALIVIMLLAAVATMGFSWIVIITVLIAGALGTIALTLLQGVLTGLW